MMQCYGNRQKHLNPNPIQRVLLNKFHRQIIKLVQQTGTTCLLDAGCGEGFVINHLRSHRPEQIIFGGDFNAEALHWGEINIRHHAPLVNFDLHRLPFADNSFPLTMCLEVLEHLPDSKIGLRELARVSSAYVLVSVPHEPWFRTINFWRGKHWSAWGNDPEHLHNYTGSRFRGMLNSVVDIIWHGYAFPWQIALARKRE